MPSTSTARTVVLYDAPGHDVEADTPNGRMWFENRDAADAELADFYPGVTVVVRRTPAPAIADVVDVDRTLVEVHLEAVDPAFLGLPTTACRWYVTDTSGFRGPVVHLTGEREAVETFIRQNWGDEYLDGDDPVVLDLVTPTLDIEDLRVAGDACTFLAGVDEGENTDYDTLVRVAATIDDILEISGATDEVTS